MPGAKKCKYEDAIGKVSAKFMGVIKIRLLDQSTGKLFTGTEKWTGLFTGTENWTGIITKTNYRDLINITPLITPLIQTTSDGTYCWTDDFQAILKQIEITQETTSKTFWDKLSSRLKLHKRHDIDPRFQVVLRKVSEKVLLTPAKQNPQYWRHLLKRRAAMVFGPLYWFAKYSN